MTSCGYGPVDNIELNSELILPEDYEIIENKTIESGLAGSDYQIKLELKFDSINFKKLIESVPKQSEFWNYENDEIKYFKYSSSDKIISITLDLKSKKLYYTEDKI